jgi:hypothetical protein
MAGALRITGFLLLAHFAAAFVAVAAGGAGHGIYLPAIVLFPYSMLAFMFSHEALPGLTLVVVQFLGYSVIASIAASRESLPRTVRALATCHGAVALIAVCIAVSRGGVPLLVP